MCSGRSWIVGLDLDVRSRGALAFADWLGQTGDSVTGVYVLESWSRPFIRGDVLSGVHDAVSRAGRELGLAPLSRVTVLEAEVAEAGLTRAASEAAGLVIGRAAGVGGRHLIRLGGVARRLVRQLPVPVIVVPPDCLTVAAGPILLATDLATTSPAAIAFARMLAADHRRPLELVHVGKDFYNDLIDELEPSWLAAREQHRAGVARAAEVWAEAHGLSGVPCHLRHGDPAEELTAAAAARDAAVLVVGSRHLGLAARVFLSSTASALAGLATCPVAIVPPS